MIIQGKLSSYFTRYLSSIFLVEIDVGITLCPTDGEEVWCVDKVYMD